MKISDEGSRGISADEELSVENMQPVSVVLPDNSMEVLPEQPAAPVQTEDLPALHPIEESINDEVNLASTPVGETSLSVQQDVIDEDVSHGPEPTQ